MQGYKFGKCPGVIHCFSGNLGHARKLMDMGFYIGVTGMFAKKDIDSEVCIALKSIPLKRIVFETDSPYLVPKGIEGKRNTSENLGVIVERFAELRDNSVGYIGKVALENIKRLYPTIFVEQDRRII